jgi:transcriptional regulator with XRE-family HTH domain
MARHTMGATIRLLRERRGLSLTELARILKTDKGYLSCVETNKKTPTLPTLRRIAKALHVTPGAIVDGEHGDAFFVFLAREVLAADADLAKSRDPQEQTAALARYACARDLFVKGNPNA